MPNLTNVRTIPSENAAELSAAMHGVHDTPDALCPSCILEVYNRIHDLKTSVGFDML